MDFEIEKKEFLKGLGSIQSIAARKTTLPILSHVLLEVGKDSLFLTGTDLETGIREELSAEFNKKEKPRSLQRSSMRSLGNFRMKWSISKKRRIIGSPFNAEVHLQSCRA